MDTPRVARTVERYYDALQYQTHHPASSGRLSEAAGPNSPARFDSLSSDVQQDLRARGYAPAPCSPQPRAARAAPDGDVFSDLVVQATSLAVQAAVRHYGGAYVATAARAAFGGVYGLLVGVPKWYSPQYWTRYVPMREHVSNMAYEYSPQMLAMGLAVARWLWIRQGGLRLGRADF